MGKTRKQRIKNNSRAKTIKNNKNLLSNEQDMEGGYGVIQHGGATEGAFDTHYKIIQNNDRFKTIRAFLRQISLFFFRGRYFKVNGYDNRMFSPATSQRWVRPRRGRERGRPINKYEFFMINKNIHDIGRSDETVGDGYNIEDYLSMLQSVVGMSDAWKTSGNPPYGVLGDRLMTQLSGSSEKRFKEFRKIFYLDSAELYGPHEYEYEYLDETNILNYIIEQLKFCLVEPDNLSLSDTDYNETIGYLFSNLNGGKDNKNIKNVLLYWHTGYAHALTELACRLLFPLNDGSFNLNDMFKYFNTHFSKKEEYENLEETIDNIHINEKNVDRDPPNIIEIAKLARFIISYHSYMTERTVQFKGAGVEAMEGIPEDADWSKGNQLPKIILMMRLFRFVCFQGDTFWATTTRSSKTGTKTKTPSLQPSKTWFGKRFDSGTMRMNNRINEAATQLYLNQDIKINAPPPSADTDPPPPRVATAPDDLDESMPRTIEIELESGYLNILLVNDRKVQMIDDMSPMIGKITEGDIIVAIKTMRTDGDWEETEYMRNNKLAQLLKDTENEEGRAIKVQHGERETRITRKMAPMWVSSNDK
jgi:hypothetical protein